MSSRAVVVLVTVFALLVAACFASDDGKPVRQTRSIVSAKLPPKGLVGPPAVPAEGLVYVGDKGLLPKHKTKWEKRIERLMAAGKAGSDPHAAWYDDYRNTNIADFFITKPPTTTTFRAPAEYEESQAYLATVLTNDPAMVQMHGEIIKGAWGIVPLLLIYVDAAHKTALEQGLIGLGYTAAEIQDPKNVIWWQHQLNAFWTRDFGPLGIVTTGATPGTLSFVDFRYYPTRPYDDEVPTDLAKDWGINVFRPDLDFEGGNFMNTSDGLCAQSKVALAHNPQFTQSAVEDIFKQYLACKAFVWPEPMAGDGTGHIDMSTKFGSDTTVMVGEFTAAQDSTNKAILDANAGLFASATTPSGNTITVTRIPMPDKGGTAPNTYIRTYTNSVSLKGATQQVVLVPVYAQESSKEAAAMAAYATVFPGWTFVKITSDVIIPMFGATHCITMQIPVGTKAKMEADPADLCGPQKLYCVSGPCGNITSAGCCQGQTLKYCQAYKIVSEDCTGNPSCGWDSTQSWYGCGTTGTPDPSGTEPMSCDVITDAAPPDFCGNVTWEGCCDGETLYWCDNGQLNVADCTNSPKCGWDSSGSYYNCGTGGTADPNGTHPMTCAFGDGGPPKPDTGPGCGAVTWEGCCDGETLKYCESNQLNVVDCTNNPSCGWNPSGPYYDCNTDGSADPSGTHPKQCAATGDAAVPDLPQPDLAAPDAPWLPDQQVQADQPVTQPDGLAKTDGGGDDDGCGCRVAAAPDRSALPLLLLGLALGLVLVGRERGRR